MWPRQWSVRLKNKEGLVREKRMVPLLVTEIALKGREELSVIQEGGGPT